MFVVFFFSFNIAKCLLGQVLQRIWNRLSAWTTPSRNLQVQELHPLTVGVSDFMTSCWKFVLLICFDYTFKTVDLHGPSTNTSGQTPWTYGRVVELSILNSSSSESSIEDSGIESPGAGSVPSSRNSPLSLSEAITSTSTLSSMLVSYSLRYPTITMGQRVLILCLLVLHRATLLYIYI